MSQDLITLDQLIIGAVALAGSAVLALLKWAYARDRRDMKEKFDSISKEIDSLKNCSSKVTDELKDKVEGAISQVQDMRESILSKQVEKTSELMKLISENEDCVRNLELKLAEGGVSKMEFKEAISELKLRINTLEGSIQGVAQVTQEQAILLARIDSLLRSLI